MLPRLSRSRWLAGTGLLVLAGLTIGAASPIEPNLLAGLRWRNIGPFRGGRVAAVTGVVGQPGTFYIGLPLGGVWKTTSAGMTWYPIFDAVKEASSVGAVQVAPSDPNIIYVGMGDLITGGGINEGNGVYKSTDAGKTWTHLGLDETKQIPSILVDPKDPNIVMVAAQGNIRTPSENRGLYRSTDGGKSWNKTLYVDSTTGIQEITWAYDNPKVMLATTVRHYNAPAAGRGAGGGAAFGGGRGRGAGGCAPAGPTGTEVYKSTDEGVTWHQLTIKLTAPAGCPSPSMTGRTSIAVAMNTNSQRMFVIGNFGLYRSDDGGTTWKQMAANDRRIANGQNGYNCGVYVDPTNPDIVYTINTSSFKSVDGGNTFVGFKGAPGGDDPQQMWIDPTNGKRMLLGVDQGATVSLDGGATWSSWYNQETEQVYHISVDNSYPYWVYATQQDAGAVRARSRGDLGEITPFDWYPVAGYEFGSIVADPLNPNIVYSGGPSSGIVKITYPSGQWINVSPNVDPAEGLRKVGNQPLAWSESNPHELLTGFQYLMSTTDGGMHWKKLSPDLGYAKGVTPPAPAAGRGGGRGGRGGGAGGPAGGSIESFATSSVAPGVIWVGTNDGLIKVTKDHGATWTDVSIPGVANATGQDISAIDASHQDPATAYVAIDTHGARDMTPYFFRTHDYGKTWTKIITGMRNDQPSGSFARVIRADTKKAGLLFAGTESSMYVSFDDGDNWQSLMLNLPNTSYRDMVIKDNDLVVGTYGRSFWVLDDISPLRQITPTTASEAAHLFKPGDAVRVRRNVNGDTPFPPEIPHAENPPLGAVIYYYLGSKPSGDITLDIIDAGGRVVRHMSSAAIPPLNEPPPVLPSFWLEKPEPMPTEIGTNRINWNIRYDNPPAFSHNYEINANPGETPASPEGPLALPGVYTAKLTVDGKSYTQTFSVRNDPRSPASVADLRAQHDLQLKLYDGARESWDGYQDVTAMRAAVAEVDHANPAPDVAAAAKTFDSMLVVVGGAVAPGGRAGVRPNATAPAGIAPTPTFAALVGTMDRQLTGLDNGDMAPNAPTLATFAPACADLKAAVTRWQSVSSKDLSALNAKLAAAHMNPVPAATHKLAALVCTVAPAAVPAAGGRGARKPGI